MTNQSNIEKIVMQRVYRMRVLRFLFSNAMLAAFVAMLALWGVGREVWVARVVENMPHTGGFAAAFAFWVAAFSHTRLVVQGLALITLAALAALARETARLVASVLTPLRA